MSVVSHIHSYNNIGRVLVRRITFPMYVIAFMEFSLFSMVEIIDTFKVGWRLTCYAKYQ